MDNDRVHESSEENGVAQVGTHLAALGDGACHDGGSCGRESELEEEERIVCVISERKVAIANERDALLLPSKGQGETNREETNGTATGIQEVLEDNVFDILLTNRARTKHGESDLHAKDQGALFEVESNHCAMVSCVVDVESVTGGQVATRPVRGSRCLP